MSRIAGLGLGCDGDEVLILSSGSFRLKIIIILRKAQSSRLQMQERISLAEGNLECFLEMGEFEPVLKQTNLTKQSPGSIGATKEENNLKIQGWLVIGYTEINN